MPPWLRNESRRYLPSSTFPSCDAVVDSCSSTVPSLGQSLTVAANDWPHCGQRVISTSGAWGAAILTHPLPNLFDDRGRGVTRLHRYPDDLSAAGLDGVAADDGILGPVGALDEHVGLKRRDDVVRRLLVEDHDAVDRRQRRQNLRALRLGRDRPAGAFDRAHRSIGVQADDEGVAE